MALRLLKVLGAEEHALGPNNATSITHVQIPTL
jgi:hypothetical protein